MKQVLGTPVIGLRQIIGTKHWLLYTMCIALLLVFFGAVFILAMFVL